MKQNKLFQSFDYGKMAKELEPNIRRLREIVSEMKTQRLLSKSDVNVALEEYQAMLTEHEALHKLFLTRAAERRK